VFLSVSYDCLLDEIVIAVRYSSGCLAATCAIFFGLLEFAKGITFMTFHYVTKHIPISQMFKLCYTDLHKISGSSTCTCVYRLNYRASLG